MEKKNKPHKTNTDTHEVRLKRKRTFTLRKACLFLSILLIIFGILYFNNKSNSDKYHIAQDGITSDTQVNKGTDAQKGSASYNYTFKSESLLQEYFDKHGSEFGYKDASQYERGASAVINSPDALHKTEKVDGDDVYYIVATNEFVVLSTEGYIRTYFKPDDGIEYYNRQ